MPETLADDGTILMPIAFVSVKESPSMEILLPFVMENMVSVAPVPVRVKAGFAPEPYVLIVVSLDTLRLEVIVYDVPFLTEYVFPDIGEGNALYAPFPPALTAQAVVVPFPLYEVQSLSM
jgi:hypothetical protein